jgi:hypothetical protein
MKQSPIKNMAYWKGKNTISPVKQYEKKKEELVEKEEVIKTGPKPNPSELINTPKGVDGPKLPRMKYVDPDTREETDTYPE